MQSASESETGKDFVVPEHAEINTLYEIAKDGDMDEVTAYLEKIEANDLIRKCFASGFDRLP